MNSITSLAFILRLHSICHFWSHETQRKASNSEIRRWIENGSVLFNTEKVKCNELIDFPVFSLVMFPKSDKNKITLL